jgi:hypothetical protein
MCCCTVTMRLRTVCQSSSASAHGLSVQKCACARSVSATLFLRTVCQCNIAPAHGLSVQQCSCARPVSVALPLSTLVCQCSNFCPLKEFLFCPTLRTRLISSLVIYSCVQERNHMHEIVVSRVCRKFMNSH